ncbi:hypothetical protein PUR59_10910 [Streptomyces sp. SP18ES09]|uniref:hypothetical protein n=1 Tax=Streptomyces sp. SP18ES09 TaxID=3002532 RepID=UPI002E77E293|nr:hypothetical protein [Streptomyces sp. SP18ES09]MEE1815522.1 hypothetical protein [Streptomyces sp. SP18ES09]
MTLGLLAAAGGAVYDLDGTGPSFTPGYADVELTAPDDGYEFDLGAGKVVPAETSDWYLSRDKDALVLPEEADAFVASGYVLSPEDCDRGIETEPVTSLPSTTSPTSGRSASAAPTVAGSSSPGSSTGGRARARSRWSSASTGRTAERPYRKDGRAAAPEGRLSGAGPGRSGAVDHSVRRSG